MSGWKPFTIREKIIEEKMGRSYVDNRYLNNHLVVKIGVAVLCSLPFMILFYYNLSHVGCWNHQNHPKLSQEEITYPTRWLETLEKTLLDDIGNANVSYGISINVLYEKKGNN